MAQHLQKGYNEQNIDITAHIAPADSRFDAISRYSTTPLLRRIEQQQSCSI